MPALTVRIPTSSEVRAVTHYSFRHIHANLNEKREEIPVAGDEPLSPIISPKEFSPFTPHTKESLKLTIEEAKNTILIMSNLLPQHDVDTYWLGYKSHEYLTELMMLAMLGEIHSVKLLIQRGDDLNEQEEKHGLTALMLAAHYDKYDVVEELLQAGANRYVTDFSGKTAMGYARGLSHDLLCILPPDNSPPYCISNSPTTFFNQSSPRGKMQTTSVTDLELNYHARGYATESGSTLSPTHRR